MNLKQFSLALAGAVASSLALAAAQAAVPAAVAAAVTDASRPATDTQRDADRKPTEVVTFAGVKPGDQIGELQPGRGYYTRILCKVVGDKGHIYTVAIAPPPRPDAPMGGQGGNRSGGGPAAAAAPPPAGTPCANVSASRMPAAEFKLPGSLDLVWTSENYHDYHNESFGVADLKAFNKVIFDALKPGGVYIVEDHAAEAGSGTRDTNTLHRIDPAAAIAEITGVGFVLDAQSKVLAHAEDKHTENSGSLNGKSDKFLLKFRKPAK